MKFCNGCQTLKSFSCFSSDKSKSCGRASQCKECNRAKNQKARDDLWKRIEEYVGGRKCAHCGIESEYPIYDFHHLDPTEKEREVTRSLKWDKVKAEIDKCIMLCSNCHRIEHYRLRKNL